MNKTSPFLNPSRIPLIKIIAGIGLNSLSALSSFGLLFLSGWFLTATAIAGLGGIVTQNLFNIFLPASGIRFFATVRIVCRYAERLVTHDASLQVISKFRTALFKKLLPQSSYLTNTNRSGDLLTRLVQDTEWSGQYLTDIIQPFITAIICALIYVVVISAFSPVIGLAIFCTQAVSIFVIPLLIARFLRKNDTAITNTTIKMRATFIETLQMQEDIGNTHASDHFWEKLDNNQRVFNAHYLRLIFKQSICEQLQELVILLTLCFCLYTGAHAILNDTLTSAQFPMLILGVLATFATCSPLINAAKSLQQARNSEKRITELTQNKESVKAVLPVCMPEFKPQLSLRNIQFIYPSTKRKILNALDLDLSVGEKIGITGPSGSGKSTILRGLMRLIYFNAGYAEISDLPLDTLDTQALSHHVGLLEQNPHIFQGTIRSNLTFACPSASESDLWNALKQAHLSDEVQAMPERLDTPVGNQGVQLSGGQRKRLAIAQLILRRPKLLLLDEPCEGLPHRMAREVMKDFLNAFSPSTTSVLCICHRSEPLEFMDRILTLRQRKLFTTTNMEKLQMNQEI